MDRYVEFLGGFVGEEDRLRQEVFFLAYHLHWGREEVLSIPTEERWHYVRHLSEQLEREQDAINGAAVR
ncbi:DUF6760 family protein [Streptomyces sp. NPDC004980]